MCEEHRVGGDVETADPVLQRALAAAHSLAALLGSRQKTPRQHEHRCQVALLSSGTLSY